MNKTEITGIYPVLAESASNHASAKGQIGELRRQCEALYELCDTLEKVALASTKQLISVVAFPCGTAGMPALSLLHEECEETAKTAAEMLGHIYNDFSKECPLPRIPVEWW